jgi:hypothetical protein
MLATTSRRPHDGRHRAAPSGPEAYRGTEERKEVNMAQYEAYCVKDREKVTFEGEIVTLKNGRKAAKGSCPKCGTTVMRILSKEQAAAAG